MEYWKRLVYIIAAIQVGMGITIIGVVSFIPLFSRPSWACMTREKRRSGLASFPV